MYVSIARAVRRRPRVADDSLGFVYHRGSMVVLVVLTVLSAVEIVVIDVVVHQWLWLRIPLLVVGVWGLVWMTGFLCAHLVRPHTIGPDGVRVRDAMDLEVHVRWDDVHSVALRTRSHEPKSPRVVEESDHTRSFVLAVADRTNVEVVLEGPTTISLPGLAPHGGPQVVDRLQYWTDDPKDLLAAVREQIGGEPGTAPGSASEPAASGRELR